MWRKLDNFLLSINTYDDLSPDLGIRQQVKQYLINRSALSLEQWFHCYGKAVGISQAVVQFAYLYLEQYSGLPFARVLPNDRLEEDLHWTEVCWFDWEVRLCEDFWQHFEIDLSDRLEEFVPFTIAELILFLEQQVCDS
jgi:hypothetical protein